MKRLFSNRRNENTVDREADPITRSEDEDAEFDGNVELLEVPEDENSVSDVSSDEPRTLTNNPPLLLSEDINLACFRYIKKHLFYGSKFLKEMTLKEIKNDNAFHYILETFCERRKCALTAYPYSGQDIDGPENGPSPNPWDINVQPPAMFQEGKATFEIPHTSFVQRCDVCFGSCYMRCVSCAGMGGKLCSPCGGSGQSKSSSCAFCSGTGRKWCISCHGTGQTKCLRCDSLGNLKYCRVLIVKWLKINDEFISNTHYLPPKHIKKVSGSEIFSEEQKKLAPIKNAPDEMINEASLTIMRGQKESLRYMRILRQVANYSFPAMAEKKMDDLPPSYTNLSYDSEPVSGPSAPRFPGAPKFEGYGSESTSKPSPPKYDEGATFDGNSRGHAANPSAPPPDPEPRPGTLSYTPPNLVFENIYEACVEYADQNCCYGKRFLNQMKLNDVINKAVFYYKLESFTEKRESESKSAPYKGERVDGRENGVEPEPWSMTVHPPELFNDCDVTTKIPHTDRVYTCTKCNGAGDIICDKCRGKGTRTCSWCDGSGRTIFFSKCGTCNGDGWKVCWTCIGMGKFTCSSCSGHGKIKNWKDLKVTWKNHVKEYFTDAGNLPVDLIRKAQGVELFKKKDLSLEPITNAPDATVNTASARLLESHLNSFRSAMIIRQRHELRAVPLTRVTYQWKDEDGEFYVYDTDRKVHFDFYPQPYCCCTCS